jgi:peptidoglycan/xylan/chitin deacetylase (PgdA/CDA1 family)
VRALRVSIIAGIVWWALASGAGARVTVVSLEFDHAFADALRGVALVHNHGMPATLFAMSGRVGQPGYLTYPQLVALQAQGDEVGGHTAHHPDLSKLKPAEQRSEICDDRAALQQAGLEVTDFSYPFGYFNAATPGIVRSCGYESARQAGGLRSRSRCQGSCSAAETIAPRRVYATRSADSVRETTSVATLERYVTRARRSGGGWVQLVFHHVCDRCDSYAVSEPTLAAFLSWLDAQRVRVETVRQVIETPFHPGRARIRAGRRATALQAGVTCPRAPGTAVCTRAPFSTRPVRVPAGLGSRLTVLAPRGASAVELWLRGKPLRARRRTGTARWIIRLPQRFPRRRATLFVALPLGTARYPFELVPIRPRR